MTLYWLQSASRSSYETVDDVGYTNSVGGSHIADGKFCIIP